MKSIIMSTIFCIIANTFVFQQSSLASDSDSWKAKLKSEQLRVSLLLQSVGVFSFDNDNFNGGRRFELGATRLDLRGILESNFTYRLQVDFRRSPNILDAQIGYKASDQFHLVAGSFKPFLSADLDPSPADTDFIDRARLVGAMLNSREIGLTVLGKTGQINYRIGMYNGYGLQTANDGRFLYTARLGYSPNFGNQSVELGLNGAINMSENERVGNTGLSSTGDRILYGGFIKYNSEGLFGTVEFLQTKFEDRGRDETITGFYTTIGYKVSPRDEVLVRWDHLSYDIRDSSSELFILGWNHQATDLISFQLNFLGLFVDGVDEQLGISGNFQFAF